MGLVILGLVLVGLKWVGISVFATWPWWAFLLPFGAAVVWWQVSDALGWTSRAAQEREQQRVKRRRDAHIEAMGMRPNGSSTRNGTDKSGSFRK